MCVFLSTSCPILSNERKFFRILWTWLSFPCSSKDPGVTIHIHWSAWESFHWLLSNLNLIQIIILISLHLILSWLHIPSFYIVQSTQYPVKGNSSAAVLVHYAICSCTVYAKTFLVFEAGMCISLLISWKWIAVEWTIYWVNISFS